MAIFRAFIAIDIKIEAKIREILKDLSNSNTKIKIVEPEKMHITLKFLGDTKEEKIKDIINIIKEVIKDIKPFKISLSDTGVFPNKNYIKVLWIGINNSDELIKIADRLNEKLSKIGFKKDKRKFSAHLTIARVRSSKNKEKLIEILKKYKDINFSNFEVKSIKLIKSKLTSKGPIYTTIKELEIK